MILFANNNLGILFLSSLTGVLEQYDSFGRSQIVSALFDFPAAIGEPEVTRIAIMDNRDNRAYPGESVQASLAPEIAEGGSPEAGAGVSEMYNLRPRISKSVTERQK